MIGNAVMRFNAQKADNNRSHSLPIQESVIRQQSKLLPSTLNTIIPTDWIDSFPSLVQSHLERIAGFTFERQWWWITAHGIEFLDGPDEILRDKTAPSHFRLSSIKSEKGKVTLV